MSQHQLLAAIAQAPLDAQLRFIYADWLEEHGSTLCHLWRGEYRHILMRANNLHWDSRRGRNDWTDGTGYGDGSGDGNGDGRDYGDFDGGGRGYGYYAGSVCIAGGGFGDGELNGNGAGGGDSRGNNTVNNGDGESK